MTAVSDADRAKAAESTLRKPLSALEWLRVTHADTLSGRRIEEAIAEARAPYEQLAADLRALAEGELDEMADSHSECGPDHRPCLDQLAEDVGQRLLTLVAAAEEAKA